MKPYGPDRRPSGRINAEPLPAFHPDVNDLKKVSKGRDLDKQLAASEALGEKIAGMFIGGTEEGVKNVLINPVQNKNQRQKTESYNGLTEHGVRRETGESVNPAYKKIGQKIIGQK